jgi:hypothetical protein
MHATCSGPLSRNDRPSVVTTRLGSSPHRIGNQGAAPTIGFSPRRGGIGGKANDLGFKAPGAKLKSVYQWAQS